MFTFEPGVALWAIVSFFIVLIFIQKKVYPPIRKALDERQSYIEKNLADADQRAALTQKLQAEVEDKLNNLKLEEHRIISEAREKAKKLAEEYEQKAFEEFRKLRKQKEEDLRKIEENFFQNMGSKLTSLIVSACEKVLKTSLTAAQQQQIIDSRIEELEKIR